jgi:sugar (pentulose or hexulose) kinase
MSEAAMAKDITSYIMLRMAGSFATGPTILQSAGILNNYKRRYNRNKILDKTGLSRISLPAIMNEPLTADHGLKVLPPLTDSIAGAVSAGAFTEGATTLNVGTTATLYHATSKPVTLDGFYLDLSSEPDMFYVV